MSATLRCDTIQNASSATANLTLDDAGNATVGNTLVMGSSFKRNRIINGDMRINQRATAVTTTDAYSVDRWVFVKSNDATESVAQNTDAPTGFSYSLRDTISVADTSIGASQYSGFRQIIEGYNVADLGFGTASARRGSFRGRTSSRSRQPNLRRGRSHSHHPCRRRHRHCRRRRRSCW